MPPSARTIGHGSKRYSNRTQRQNGRGLTPVMYCAVVGSSEATKLLVQHGAEINERNAFGSMALMWSVANREKIRLQAVSRPVRTKVDEDVGISGTRRPWSAQTPTTIERGTPKRFRNARYSTLTAAWRIPPWLA